MCVWAKGSFRHSVWGWGGGGGGVESAKREAQAQILEMLQTWQSDLSLSQSQWEIQSVQQI